MKECSNMLQRQSCSLHLAMLERLYQRTDWIPNRQEGSRRVIVRDAHASSLLSCYEGFPKKEATLHGCVDPYVPATRIPHQTRCTVANLAACKSNSTISEWPRAEALNRAWQPRLRSSAAMIRQVQSRSYGPLVWAPDSESLQTHYNTIIIPF